MLFLLLLAACSSDPAPVGRGPVLVGQNTLEPTIIMPTRPLTNTPSPGPDAATRPASNAEIIAPINTPASNFVLITPTLPPSKTPTTTPTASTTPTFTPIPSQTLPPAPTRALFPTSAIIPVTAPPQGNANNPPIVSVPPVGPGPGAGGMTLPAAPQVCASAWFFANATVTQCPQDAPTVTFGAVQNFERGFMVWLQNRDAIFVIYNDTNLPAWQVFVDNFVEGQTPEDDPQFTNPPSAGLHQPRRGIGLVWRENPAVRDRLGWATNPQENAFSANTQIGQDGTFYVSGPNGEVLELSPNGIDWRQLGG